MRSSLVLMCAALALLFGCLSARKVLPKKLKTQGKTYKIHASSDLDMCAAVVREMHTEVLKHGLIDEGGEDPVYDTAGMAICLGVVQNYTFELGDKKVWRLKKRPKPIDDDDDEEDNIFMNGGPEVMEGLLLTKKACMDFAEETQNEISEVIYAKVHGATGQSGQEIAEEFCPGLIKPEKKTKMHNADKGYEAQADQPKLPKDPSDPRYGQFMSDFLKERDHSGAINEMLMMEAEHPEKMLDDDLQLAVKKGREELVCPVCRAAVREVSKRVKDLRSTPRYKDKWQREAVVTEVVQRICHGRDYERLEQGYYPTVPGNPPEWAEDFDVAEKDGKWVMFRAKKQATTSEEDEGSDEGGEADPQRDTMRRAMISLACKDSIDARLVDEEGDLAALLVDNPDQSPKWMGDQYCAQICKKSKEEL